MYYLFFTYNKHNKMALSFRSVEKAYTVFNKLGVESIPAFPQDMQEWTEE